MAEKKIEGSVVPDTLPEGFPSVKPHVNSKPYRYTIMLRNGNYYPITSDARSTKELFSRIVTPPGTDDEAKKSLLDFTPVSTPTGVVTYYHFPEATLGVGPGEENSIEAVVANWPAEEDLLDDSLEDDDEDEDEDDTPRRKKPKKPG
jgi:hypothetical protein